MKRISWITVVLIFLTVVFAAMGSLCGAVDQLATDRHFYSGMSRDAAAQHLGAQDAADRDAQVTAYIGMTEEAQDAFAAEIVSFMEGATDALPDVLNENERQHMLDVRTIVQPAAGMSRMYMTMAAVLAVIAAWAGAKSDRRWLSALIGLLCAVSLIMLVVSNVASQMGAGGFETLFVQMHEALFANDLWLMDPAEDILIRMMPQNLFEQALVNAASLALRMMVIVTAMLAAVHGIVRSMIRRHWAKK